MRGGDSDGRLGVCEKPGHIGLGMVSGFPGDEDALCCPIAGDRIFAVECLDQEWQVFGVAVRGGECEVGQAGELCGACVPIARDRLAVGKFGKHGFGDEPSVFYLDHFILKTCPHGGEAFNVAGVGREVIDLPGVGLQIEKFLDGLIAQPYVFMPSLQFALFPGLLPGAPSGLTELIVAVGSR